MAIDRRKELVEAAARGITEWLNTLRGANACGPNAKVTVRTEKSTYDIQVVSSDGITTLFDTMEL